MLIKSIFNLGLPKRRLTWHGEGGHDPTERVGHVAGYVVGDAVDGAADEVVGCDQEAADEAQGGRCSVMEFEEGRVDVGFLTPVPDLEERNHF